MTIMNLINEFRQINSKKPIENWNRTLDDHCLSHTLAMINKGEIYHAPRDYLKNYDEIVWRCDFMNTWDETFRHLIFELIGKSEEHKKILLESQELGYGVMSDKNKVYITIRGK